MASLIDVSIKSIYGVEIKPASSIGVSLDKSNAGSFDVYTQGGVAAWPQKIALLSHGRNTSPKNKNKQTAS